MFYYTTITRERVLASNQLETSWTTNAFLLLERFFLFREIPGAKKDLLNGDRVYRVHAQDVVRLDLDNLGRRHVENRSGIYLFDVVDPTAGVASKDDVWLPVGP